jgi:2'-5' RNA ligase
MTELRYSEDQPRDPDGKFGSGSNLFSHAPDESAPRTWGDWHSGARTLERVDVKDLVPTQTDVNPMTGKTLKEEIEGTTFNGKKGEYGQPGSDRANVVAQNGKYYIADGHHRLGQAILDGQKSVLVYVYQAKSVRSIAAGGADTHDFLDDVKPHKNVDPKPVATASGTDTGLSERDQLIELFCDARSHKFGNTQIDIPEESDAHAALESVRELIADEDIHAAADIGHHVTVRYGIVDDDHRGLINYIAQQTPFDAVLGTSIAFPPSDHSEGASVIVAPVTAPELTRINAEIGKHGQFKPENFEYTPHATIAYVKPDRAERYVGLTLTQGKTFRVESITISARNGDQTQVRMQGKPLPQDGTYKPLGIGYGPLGGQQFPEACAFELSDLGPQNEPLFRKRQT